MGKKVKKLLKVLLIMVFVVSLVACGNGKQELNSEDTLESSTNSIEKDILEKTPSGINEDGIGEDPDFGEGIGEVVALSDDEKAYVQAQTTNSWLKMTKEEKDDFVVPIGRWLEETKDYIIEDYDELVSMLDHQMEQYYRNSVDEGVFDTVCDILNIE